MLDIVVRHGPVSSIEPSAADGVYLLSSEAIQTPLSTIYYLLSLNRRQMGRGARQLTGGKYTNKLFNGFNKQNIIHFSSEGVNRQLEISMSVDSSTFMN